MADAPPPPPKVEPPPVPLPEPREAIRSRVQAFREQVRPLSLPVFALPGVQPTEGRCESCGEPSSGRCPLCIEAARYIIEDMIVQRKIAKAAAAAPPPAKS